MKHLILIWSLFYMSMAQAVPPTGIKGQSGSINYSVNAIVPYNQATKLSGSNVLVETDSENMLVNPNFEHSTVGTGWTLGTSNTLTATTTSANLFSGKQDAILTTSATVAFNLYQDVTPVSGLANTQGEITWAVSVPSGITDGKICSRINGTTSTTNCVQVANNGVYREYSLPVIFGTAGQTAGLAFVTTATYASGTQSVLVSKARIRAGLSTQALMGDVVYSATATSTGANITLATTSKTGWVAVSYSTTGQYLFTFQTGLFTVVPSCVMTSDSSVANTTLQTPTIGSISLFTRNDAGAFANGSGNFSIHCTKQGADYLTASSYVYTQANANSTWAPCTFSTLAWQGLGTVTNNLQCQRTGSILEMKGSVTLGTVAASLAQFPLPNNWGAITTQSSSTNDSYGLILRGAAATTILTNAIATSGLGYFQISNPLTTSTNNPLTAVNGSNAYATGDTITFVNMQIPITGWFNSSTTTGSFSGVPTVPGQSGNVDTFSVSYGTTNATTVCSANPCSYFDQIGSGATSMGWTSTGLMTLNFAKTYSKVKCTQSIIISGVAVGGVNGNLSCSNCNSLTVNTLRADTGANANSNGTLYCQGTY